jgi:hypothetical protein
MQVTFKLRDLIDKYMLEANAPPRQATITLAEGVNAAVTFAVRIPGHE